MSTLGLGLIGIGRTWGVVESPIPSETEVLEFLDFAFQSGIRFFDTAPAYGLSEQRFGKWLHTLSVEQRTQITVATKCGEFWDFAKNSSYKTYSAKELLQSIDHSLELLGSIDVLQIHGVTPQVLNDFLPDIQETFFYAKSIDIETVGISISDPAAFTSAIEMSEVKLLQIQHNVLKPYDPALLKLAEEHSIQLVTNRPFGMGELALRADEDKLQALRFLHQTVPTAVVLTGTKSKTHLRENIELFAKAAA